MPIPLIAAVAGRVAASAAVRAGASKGVSQAVGNVAKTGAKAIGNLGGGGGGHNASGYGNAPGADAAFQPAGGAFADTHRAQQRTSEQLGLH
jgi:hypothetical protein